MSARSLKHRFKGGAPRLSSLISLAHTGCKAPMSTLVSGAFALKVANLTGQGIDWVAYGENWIERDRVPEAMFVKPGDIFLTATAHDRKYLGAKVDIVSRFPRGRSWTTFTGDVMRVRAKPDVDPYALLLMLRRPEIRAALAACATGWAAHLKPGDLLDIPLPEAVFSHAKEAANLLVFEASFAVQKAEATLDLRTLYRLGTAE